MHVQTQPLLYQIRVHTTTSVPHFRTIYVQTPEIPAPGWEVNGVCVCECVCVSECVCVCVICGPRNLYIKSEVNKSDEVVLYVCVCVCWCVCRPGNPYVEGERYLTTMKSSKFSLLLGNYKDYKLQVEYDTPNRWIWEHILPGTHSTWNTFQIENILYAPAMNMIHPVGDFETT